MGLLALAWWTWKLLAHKWKMLASGIFALIGGIMMSVNYWSPQESQKAVYYASQVFVCLDFVIASVILMETALNCTFCRGSAKTSFEVRRERLFLGFAGSYIPLGYLLAMFIN